MLPLASVAALAAPVAANATEPADCHRKDSRPDIIFIMTDQQTLGAMSCLGNPDLSTPAMDRLASDGVLLTRAYCPFPLSGPCRASLVTGLMPVQTGATDNAIRPSQEALDNGIGHRMSDAGYDCIYAGKWHAPEINVPDDAGFTRLCNMDDRQIADACRKALEGRNSDKPLFLVASYLDPHEICEFARDETLPYGQLPAFETSECPSLPANFAKPDRSAEALDFERNAFLKSHDTYSYSNDDWRRYLYGYYRLVERVDQRIGELLKVLDDNGLYENSLIVFCSDHGDGAASHGWNQKWALYEECINVPLIVKAPKAKGNKTAGNVNSTALSNIGLDIYATFCDYAGVELDADIYLGKSLRSLAEGKAEELHEAVVSETYLSAIETRGWTIVEGRWKYVLYQYYQDREGLFDLENDRGELHNLSREESCADVLLRLRRALYDYALQVNDPKLLKQLRPFVESQQTTPSGHIKGNYR